MRANRRTPRINRAHLVGLGFESRPCGQLILRKFFPYSAATLSADLNVFHSLCDTLWKIMLPLETVTIFSWNSVVIWAMNQTDVHRPTKFPRIICTMSSDRCPPPHKIPPYHLHYVTDVHRPQKFSRIICTISSDRCPPPHKIPSYHRHYIIRQISTAPQNSPLSSALYHQTDIHRPTKYPRIICTISSDRCPPPHKIPPYHLHYIIRQMSTAPQNSPVSSALYHQTCPPPHKILLYHLHYIIRQMSTAPQNSPVSSALYHQTDIHRPTKFPRIICTISSDRCPPPHKIPPYHLHYIIRQISTAPQNFPVSSALYHQTDIHRPTKFPRIICTISSHECTVRQEPDLWEKNPVFSVDWVQVYIRMGDTWSGWQDNGNIMDPGPNIHHIAAFRSYRPTEDQIPISWTTYMRVLNCVLLCPPYNSDSWNRNFHCVFYSKYSVFNP